jgi:serine/threonine-protein kinase
MIGRRIGGRYEILSRLGEGGMAIVYKAKDLILDRLVAVKILRSDLADDQEFIKRFHREAESVASLSHPNIVAIYDIGEEEDCYYMVMEYVQGMSLKAYIRQYSPIKVSEAIHIMEQVALAIAHAHQHGIVHRDIKPHNILIDASGNVKVTDFGIALAVSSATITYTHSILGSAHYLSPEQARGGKATAKSDIYALGIVMFELLTGRLPFPGESPVSVALKHLNEPMPYPREIRPEIPQSVENIVIRATAKLPLDRYASVMEMYHDLETSLEPQRAGEERLVLDEPNPEEDADDDERTIKISTLQSAGYAVAPSSSEKTASGPEDGKKKKSGVRKWLTFTGILMLLIIAGLVIGLTVLPKMLYVSNVTVPSVTGKTFAAASKMIDSRSLKTVRRNQPNSKVKKGNVVSQDPDAGIEVKSGTKVTLFVSSGAQKIMVENYIGYSRDTLAHTLSDTGYKNVVWTGETSTSVPEGEVIRQTPRAGKRVVPENTTLHLTYSIGITVPDLSGETKDEVIQQLSSMGLKADFSSGSYSPIIPKDQVVSQQPAAGSRVMSGTTVVVSLSKGQQPQPKEIDKPIKVVYQNKGNGNSDGNDGSSRPARVQIYYTDANHHNALFIDEEITSTKTYTIPFTINPGKKGTYRISIDGRTVKDGTVDYPG